MMVKLAATKLIHPGVPPTHTMQTMAKASSDTMATPNHSRRSVFLFSLTGVYLFPTGPLLIGCSYIGSLASLCGIIEPSSSLELTTVCEKRFFSHTVISLAHQTFVTEVVFTFTVYSRFMCTFLPLSRCSLFEMHHIIFFLFRYCNYIREGTVILFPFLVMVMRTTKSILYKGVQPFAS